MLRRFIHYYKPHKWLLILDLTCAFLIAGIDLLYPMVTRDLVNNVIPNQQIELIFKYGLALLGVYLLRMVLEYIVNYYGHVLGVRMEYDMRKDIYGHLQKLSFNYFDNTKTGHIMSRVVNDLFDIAEIAHHAPEDFFISTVKIIGSFVLLLTIDVQLTLIIFLLIPFMGYFMVYYNNKLEKAFQRVRESLADVNARLEDSISGIRVVKSFTNEHYETKRFDIDALEMKGMRIKAVKHIGVFVSGMYFMSNLSIVITLVAGGYFVSLGRITVGDLIAYIIYIGLFLQPLNTFVRFIELFQQGMAGFKRFLEVMDTEPDITDQAGAAVLDNVRGDVEFRQVKFSYGNENSVLANINLTVHQGETVAIVGPSGAGKTTLCSLLPRFYEVDEGQILVDGVDIRDVTQESLRRQIGIVQQDVFLFSGTVRENIAYGDFAAGEEDIIRAAQAANAHEFIQELPNGYDTYIGEKGVKLSGGQKQRLSIARVFLKNPAILVLDEATSSLDNQSEALIQESITELAKDRTTFIIAHRLGTIRQAKRIIVLTENGIKEEGTHEELVAKQGVYCGLYESQFVGG